MRDAADLIRAYEGSANVPAFLRAIRTGETCQDDQAYKWLFGSTVKSPKLFDTFADHPRVRTYESHDGQFIKNGKIDYTTAAGAYQITESTWDPVAKKLELKDFSPKNQDICALYLIEERGALDDVIAGKFGEAMNKVRRVWASLPGAGYGQPTVAFSRLLAVYEQYGGTTASSGGIQEKEMVAPFVAAAIPALVNAVPELIKMFGSGGVVSERNAKAAEVVVGVAKEALGVKNEQELIETIQKDPSAAAQVRTAVQENWFMIQEVGGGIIAARESAYKAQAEKGLMHNPAFWVTIILMVPVYFVVFTTLQPWWGADSFTSEIKLVVVTAIISGVLSSITGFWLGSSFGSQRKDEQKK